MFPFFSSCLTLVFRRYASFSGSKEQHCLKETAVEQQNFEIFSYSVLRLDAREVPKQISRKRRRRSAEAFRVDVAVRQRVADLAQNLRGRGAANPGLALPFSHCEIALEVRVG